ncbi:3-oxoacyl-[acyl-carrier-protein] reductase [Actinacidiphila yanglinensis]|uniref:3-oxoacyl-[acyl-carrier-protein] reductase n=1 Tax=Actinacidiphila yanglinensis TaxID=310779 RepID=A0A1H6C6M1_9ACTN|nr:3-oxoacyl-ACP reductase FabG [Actinacidiphila yanglinensis]SEG68558.1 3-oxoacyl-[acyl-carrier-protein] reductase [Actinacidiphila yanglinensis]
MADDDGRRVALVSGGSRGIGRATVLRLAREGFDTSFCYRSEESAAREVVDLATGYGGRCLAVAADVTDGDAVRGWLAETESTLGPVEVAVTCAGITRDQPLVMMSDQEWDSVLSTNLTGVFEVCRAAAFAMMKRRRGSVVTLSSVAGVHGNASQTNYSASKAGIIGFSKALAKEVGRFGIRVNTVAPGLIDTDMIQAMPERSRKKLLDAVPLGRFGRAEEVADLIAYLASDRAAYVTASVFEIHGGITI